MASTAGACPARAKREGPSMSDDASAPSGTTPRKRVSSIELSAREEFVFPTLTTDQIARAAAHGGRRAVSPGEVLQSAGRQAESFFVVTVGSVELIRESEGGEGTVAVLTPGHFTGELNLLSGRRALVTLRARESGEV